MFSTILLRKYSSSIWNTLCKESFVQLATLTTFSSTSRRDTWVQVEVDFELTGTPGDSAVLDDGAESVLLEGAVAGHQTVAHGGHNVHVAGSQPVHAGGPLGRAHTRTLRAGKAEVRREQRLAAHPVWPRLVQRHETWIALLEVAVFIKIKL